MRRDWRGARGLIPNALIVVNEILKKAKFDRELNIEKERKSLSRNEFHLLDKCGI